MPTYVRYAGGHVSERIRAAPGSAEATRLEQLVAENAGWHVETGGGEQAAPAPAPSRTRPAKKQARG